MASTDSNIRDLYDVHYEYDYPETSDGMKMDLKPGKPLHEKIKARIMERARVSQRRFSARHAKWREIDKTLTAFIDLDETERDALKEDDRTPVSVVVPSSYAVLETLLTYMMSSFLRGELFRYEHVGPEDLLGTIKLERIIDFQANRSKMPLALHTQWRDGFAYGLGAVVPTWVRETGTRSRVRPVGFTDPTGQFRQTGQEKVSEEAVLYEGHKLQNISVYNLLLDPTVSITDVQSGEFFGWVDQHNLNALLARENSGVEGFFNVKYLKHVRGRRSEFAMRDETDRRDPYNIREEGQYSTDLVIDNVDTVYMYTRIIPAEWELGKKEEPELWFFALGADCVIFAAQPANLDHNMYPVAIFAPEYDGYTVSPISKIEINHGMQVAVNWLFNSHMANVRKAVNDTFIVDPFMINIMDFKSRKDGGLIRTRRAAWGRGVAGAVEQLKVTDVTRGHVADMGMIMDVMHRASGAVDFVQGVSRQRGERVSAMESRGAQIGALSRLERLATLAHWQSQMDLGYMLASQTQQLMSEGQWVKITGRFEQDINQLFAHEIQQNRLYVSPMDLDVNYDVVVSDVGLTSAGYIDLLMNAIQIIGNNEALAMRYDFNKLIQYTLQQMGFKNIPDFEIRANVMPMEQIERGVQNGSLAPIAGGQI